MKVKDVIISALNILSRSDLAKSVSSDTALDAEGQETVNTLMYCYNSVEDELARKYFPLTATDQLKSENGKFLYLYFSRTPVRIKSVKVDGKDVKYVLETVQLVTDAKKITVEYEYAPSKKNIDGVSELRDTVGQHIMAFGVVSEYFLINGEIEEAELWESKYRKSIDEVQRALPCGGTIPPRRWV